MKKLVVGSLEVLTGVMFFLIVIIAMIVGYSEMAWMDRGFLGAVIGLLVGGITAIFSTGVVYLLLSINANLVAINDKAK